MNRPSPETMNSLPTPTTHSTTAISLQLETQRALLAKWQQAHNFLDANNSGFGMYPLPVQSQSLSQRVQSSSFTDYLQPQPVKDDPGMESGWPDFGLLGGFNVNYGGSLAEVAMVGRNPSSTVEGENFKKRKPGKNQSLKADEAEEEEEEENKDKKMKACSEDRGSRITRQDSDTEIKNNSNKKKKKNKKCEKESSADTSKTNYIHVRARPGHATDRHSLAERERREKISERMRYLQDLVPGCNKITGKAGMLDEIINYVQSLQRQIEFLSMKLAAVTLDVNFDNFLSKEVFQTSNSNFPTIGMIPEIANPPPGYLQFNPSERILDSNLFNALQPCNSDWDATYLHHNLHGVEFHQGISSSSFQCQQFKGPSEVSNLKMEM